jgi:hypothetical protein
MSRRTVRRLVPFAILTVVFAALLYRAEHKAETGISHVDQHVTEITSPCLRYGPGSRQCKRSFEAAVATIDHAEACAVLRKAGLRVESCRGAHLASERRRAHEAAAREPATPSRAPAAPEGGDATSAPTGHSLPGRYEGGSSGGGSSEVGTGGVGVKESPEKLPPPSGGSGEAAPAPTAPSSPGTSSPATERTTETPVEERSPAPEAPIRQGAGVLLESVGRVVEETGGRVDEVVGGVTGTTCELAKVLCP